LNRIGRKAGENFLYLKIYNLSGGKQLRRSAQVLRSFGKQWEAKLPTHPLIINENGQKSEKMKKSAL
jgi:hypothetical protein